MVDNAAPGALDEIRFFVNTRNVEEGTDSIDSPAALAAWLTERGLMEPDERATTSDVARADALREALRALLLANNGDSADTASAQAVMNDAAEAARFSFTFAPDGQVHLDPQAKGVKGALGRLLSISAHAMADGTWSRLKACASDECQWAFYDHARNRSGRWCDMAVCGNRMKARTYRVRHG